MQAKLEAHTREIARLLEDLKVSNTALENFAYVASHELTQPLAKVVSYGEMLSLTAGASLNEKSLKYLSAMRGGADKAIMMMRELLDYSRLGRRSGEKHWVETESLLKEAVKTLESPIREAKAHVYWKHLPGVSGHPAELQRLFQNLIANAVKFRREGLSPEVVVSAERANGATVFTVTDNGIGIPEEDRERIFGLFEWGSNRGDISGTGIGLAVCKKIVEHHGGTIWVDSTVGKGTSFHFKIPSNNNSMASVSVS
jgi:signal transduction histidine kinase